MYVALGCRLFHNSLFISVHEKIWGEIQKCTANYPKDPVSCAKRSIVTFSQRVLFLKAYYSTVLYIYNYVQKYSTVHLKFYGTIHSLQYIIYSVQYMYSVTLQYTVYKMHKKYRIQYIGNCTLQCTVYSTRKLYNSMYSVQYNKQITVQ